MKRILMVAYHFPPVRVSSGLQRTLSFARNLPKHGWQPAILSAHPRAYEQTSTDQLKDIPADVNVTHAFALDTAKHLSIAGKYPKTFALPDRWASWWVGGVFSGLISIIRSRPLVIWSTYPIATAHLIALSLNKVTGIAWVADFRDSMTEDDYPTDPTQRKIYRWIEKKTIANCSKAVFTTPGALEMYRSRYPKTPEDRWALIPNGYDDEIFKEVDKKTPVVQSNTDSNGMVTLIHSGLVYPSERDPRPFFNALSILLGEGAISPAELRIRMRATGHDSLFQPMIDELGLNEIVELAPGLDYREALMEMKSADGLLILQAASCNHQIPAKLYEYFRAKRPILALTDIDGDTAKTMLWAGIETLAPLDDSEEIARQLQRFLLEIKNQTAQMPSKEAIELSSRSATAESLASVLDSI